MEEERKEMGYNTEIDNEEDYNPSSLRMKKNAPKIIVRKNT